MNTSITFKSIGAGLGAAIVFVFPTPVLITMLYCLAVVTAVDCLTGIAAAVEKNIPITAGVFIDKVGAKMIRGVSYLAIAWVAGQLVGSAMPKAAPISEPIGFVLGILITTDILSILKNLKLANNNIPILDKYFRKFSENLQDDVPDGRSAADRKGPPRPPKITTRSQ